MFPSRASAPVISRAAQSRAPTGDSVFRFLAMLPFPVLRGLFGLAASCVRLLRWRRPLVEEHLERCLAERTPRERHSVAADFYRYTGELLAEVVHADRIALPDLEARVRLENPEDLQAQLDAGKRALILAAHHCNWEWLLLRCSTAFGTPLTAAYKPVKLAAADRDLKRIRGRFGAAMVPAKQLVQHLIERRGAARLLAMVADQSPAACNEQQAWLRFFGQDTAFYQGPGWIASKLGYGVWFAAMRRERPGHYAVRFVRLDVPGERLDPDRLLQAYVAALESQVHAHPVEYFWAYNRWKREKRLYDN